METATDWLLNKLKEEGRTDLVEQWYEHNRAYQRSIAIKATEQKIEECKDEMLRMTSITSASWREQVEKRLASHYISLAKQLKEQESEAKE